MPSNTVQTAGLSAKRKAEIINPPALASADFASWSVWPIGKPVPGPYPNPTKSFWIEEFSHQFDHMRTTEGLPQYADIVIIGSGITGCSAAYHLTKNAQDLRIVMLDARGFCHGATGRNGGHCFRPEGWGFRELVERLGPEAALDERRFFMKNRDMMQEFIDQYGARDKVDCVFKGGIHIFGSEEERESHLADLKLADELGLDHGSRVLEADELSEILECFNEYGGLFCERSGSIWPRKFCALALDQAMQQGHINLQTGTFVTDITPSPVPNSRWSVNTLRGTITTRSILHATNGWIGQLVPEMMGTENEVVPARCMVIAAQPSPIASSRGTWPVNVLAREGHHYLVQMPQRPAENQENCVVYGLHASGPTADDSTLLKEPAEGSLDDYRRYLPFAFPAKFSSTDEDGRIPEKDVKYAWTGIIGQTKNENVILGPVRAKSGQFTSVGYNGAGMVKCWGSGCVIADMILWEFGQVEGELTNAWSAPDWYPKHYVKNLDELGARR